MTGPGPRYPDVCVDLVGRDGNVFAIIGRTARALRRAGRAEAADDFSEAALDCGSYDEVLQLVLATVEVT